MARGGSPEEPSPSLPQRHLYLQQLAPRVTPALTGAMHEKFAIIFARIQLAAEESTSFAIQPSTKKISTSHLQRQLFPGGTQRQSGSSDTRVRQQSQEQPREQHAGLWLTSVRPDSKPTAQTVPTVLAEVWDAAASLKIPLLCPRLTGNAQTGRCYASQSHARRARADVPECAAPAGRCPWWATCRAGLRAATAPLPPHPAHSVS